MQVLFVHTLISIFSFFSADDDDDDDDALGVMVLASFLMWLVERRSNWEVEVVVVTSIFTQFSWR